MGGLVEDGGGLVLAVALAGQGGELVEERVAVGNDVGGREGVGEDTSRAGAVDVSAVGAGDAGGGGATVVGDGAETGGNSVADVSSGGLEEGVEPGGVARGSLGGSVRSEAAAAAESVADGGAAGSSAVALDDGALGDLVDRSLDGGGLLRVDVNGDGFARVGESLASELGGVGVRVEERARSGDGVGAGLGELVQLSKLNFNLDGLAGFDGLEDLLGEVGVGQTLEVASERCRGSWGFVSRLL